ncbi:hypothetical protein DNTS_025606 [Danionella cerebrum]|uniref:Uncharacterized protein n=1 Tax=Danionella cerebrum TaxID=2873325 RepID=A0A553RHZ5_9TELE|nr:hypothetical protein DNTS_025606 [Danionella translucida]
MPLTTIYTNLKVLRKDDIEKSSVHRPLPGKTLQSCSDPHQIVSLNSKKACSSSVCRRWLPTFMLKLQMTQNLKTAITFIDQKMITDPADKKYGRLRHKDGFIDFNLVV